MTYTEKEGRMSKVRVLVLASNAAAWTAGDPAAAWTITVEVRTTER